MAKTVDNLCPELIFVLSIPSDWVDQGKGGGGDDHVDLGQNLQPLFSAIKHFNFR